MDRSSIKSLSSIIATILVFLGMGAFIASLYLIIKFPFTVVVLTVLISAFIFWNYRCKKKGRSNENIIVDYNNLDVKSIANLMIRDELKKMYPDAKVRIKKIVLKRMILTVVWAIINFLMISSFYYTNSIYIISSVLFIPYWWILCSSDTNGYLLKKVKKSPDTTISEIVRSETNYGENPKSYLGLTVLSLVVVGLSFFIFFQMHLSVDYIYKETNNGYSIEQCYPSIKREESIAIPEKFQGKPIVGIEKRAFSGIHYVTEISIPETVTFIDSGAFSGCKKLKNVKLPDNLKVLNGEAFKNCSSIKSVVIPQGVTEIRGNTFEGCSSLESIGLHDDIIDIHAYAFMGCSSLKAIDLPSKITEIHAYTFENCSSLKSVVIPSKVTRIAAHAFYGCSSLSEVFIPDSVGEIGSSAFRLCDSLTEITLPENVSVNEKAFKESPTKIYTKLFSDKTFEAIQEELSNKIIEKMYVVFNINSGKDKPYVKQNGSVLLADSDKIKTKLQKDEDVFELSDQSVLVDFLKKVKEVNISYVEVASYSQVGSDEINEPYFYMDMYGVDELIDFYENDLPR